MTGAEIILFITHTGIIRDGRRTPSKIINGGSHGGTSHHGRMLSPIIDGKKEMNEVYKKP